MNVIFIYLINQRLHISCSTVNSFNQHAALSTELRKISRFYSSEGSSPLVHATDIIVTILPLNRLTRSAIDRRAKRFPDRD